MCRVIRWFRFIVMGLAMKCQITRPETDVVLSGNLIGSQTQVAALFAPSARSFLSFLFSRVQDNITIPKEGPLWVRRFMWVGCHIRRPRRS